MNELLAVVVGWALGLFSSPFGSWIVRLLFGPRLVLKVSQSPYEFTFQTPENGEYKQVYVNVEVTNSKRRSADNCRVWLVNIEKRDGADFRTTGFHDSFPLIWAYDGDAESVPIPKDVLRQANVVTLRSDQPGFVPQLRSKEGSLLRPLQYAPMFQGHGEYRFTVLVSAQDVPSKVIRFCVKRRDGQWPPTVRAS